MKFDKEKCLIKDNSNIKVYIDKVDTDESIILDSEYVFLDSIKTTMDILVMKKTIVLGDIECNFLNAVDEIICYGNISANSIYTNKDIEYYKDIKYNNLLSGNLKKKGNAEDNIREVIKEVEVIKEIEVEKIIEVPITKEIIKEVEVIKEVIIEKEVEIEVNPLEYAEVNNKNLIDNLSIIDEFKDKILKYIEGDLIFLEDDVLVGDLKEIGLTFGEYEKYSNALTQIINYSEIDTIDTIDTLNDGLGFISAVGDLPSFLEGQDIVEDTIDKHKKVFTHEILDMKIDCEDKDDFIKLLSSLEKCKSQIEDDYDEIANKIINHYYEKKISPSSQPNSKEIEIDNKPIIENKESIADIFRELAKEELEKKEAQNKVDLEELYEKYIWKKGSLVVCKVTKVLSDYIVVEEIENNDNNIYMTMSINNSKYSIGDRIYACINNIAIEENKLKVMVSNDQDNMPRLLFNKLKELYNLNKCSIQKYKRIKGKSTCIVIVLLSKINYKDAIEDITREMEKQLDNEAVSIFVYDNDDTKFACNILGVLKSCITIDKLQNKCIATVNKVDEERINKLLTSQGTNIKNIFGYEIEVKPQENKSAQVYKDFGDIIKVPQAKTEVKDVATKTETKIEVVDKASTNTKSSTMSHRDTYINLLSKKGKIIGGKITSIDFNGIYIKTKYDAEVLIKYFDKEILEQYKVDDYIEGIIDGISKKEDGSIKATLGRLNAEFIKVLLKTVRDEIGLKNITFKAAKKLKSKNEFSVLYTSTVSNVNEAHVNLIRDKVEERLAGEVVKFYKYDFKLINLISNITGVEIKETSKNEKESTCIITCDSKDENRVKDYVEVLQHFTLCKKIEIVCNPSTNNAINTIKTEIVKEEINKPTTIEPIIQSTAKVETSSRTNEIKNPTNIKHIELIKKYNEYKWTILEGIVTNVNNNKVEFNINDEVVGVLTKSNELFESKTYKVGEKVPCYTFDVSSKNDRVELTLMKSSENYFKQLFKYYKNQLGINLISIKSCTFERDRGALILIENRYKKVSKEELEFIEELMNNECGGDIVKLVEFSYNADKFMCDLFDIQPKDIVKASGRYYISNLDYSKIEKYRFIHEKISKMVNYKIMI